MNKVFYSRALYCPQKKIHLSSSSALTFLSRICKSQYQLHWSNKPFVPGVLPILKKIAKVNFAYNGARHHDLKL